MKPVLQALVLADRVYEERTGKKIIVGTFNQVFYKRIAELIQEHELPSGEKIRLVPGGMHGGSPSAYISVTDVLDGTELTLQFVNLTKNVVLLETKLLIQCQDRLSTVEIIAPLPPLPISEEGTYAFEVVCEGEILGSHRIIAKELPNPEDWAMSTVEIDLSNNAASRTVGKDEWIESKKSYRCHILLVKEEDGTYSALVLNLPGAGSCGDTEEEAMCNVREAAAGAIESYLAAGEEIPWREPLAADIPDTGKPKWILVHV